MSRRIKNAVKRWIDRFVVAAGGTRVGGRLFQRILDSAMSRTRTVEHEGVRLAFAVPNYTNSWRVSLFSTKEPETLEWIDAFSEGSVLWDVGANVGIYSCYAAKRRRCRVFAFEPSVFNLELLARNAFLNDLTDRVTIVPLPLSDRLAVNTLNMTTLDWGGALSSFGESYGQDGRALRRVFAFNTIGLSMTDAIDRLEIPFPDYVKIDVDGIEHLILKGGHRVLSQVKSVLVEIDEVFESQVEAAAKYLQGAGLVLREKRHAEMYDQTNRNTAYNQIWHRPSL
jgi:FkbM family methyltransferase